MSDGGKHASKKHLLKLQLHPLIAKVIRASVIAACIDIAAQRAFSIKKLQLRRLLLVMLYGFAYVGPFDFFFQKLMDRLFKGKNDRKTFAKRVLLEESTYSPWNNFLYMVYLELVVEGRPWGAVVKKIRKEYPSLQLRMWKIRLMFYGCRAIFLKLKSSSGGGKKS